MATSVMVDDNGKALVDPAGLRPAYRATGVVVATTGAATAEVDVTAAFSGARNGQGQAIARIVCHTNACLFAFGAAGAAASYTTNDNMVYLPANTIEYVRLDSADVSLYHLQVTGAGTLQIAALK